MSAITTTDEFTMATWNVLYSTKVDVLRPILRRLRLMGTSLLFMQEAHGDDIAAMLKKERLEFFASDSELVVWDPKWWTDIRSWEERLAQTIYYREGSGNPVITDMACAIVSDQRGRTLTLGSYHTPPSVQSGPTKAPPRRWATLKESAATWGKMAKSAQTRAVILGGDDNVDESRVRAGATWDFLLGVQGLTLAQAPSPTHGDAVRGRKIDDFRFRNVRLADKGLVIGGGGDHRVHVRKFRW